MGIAIKSDWKTILSIGLGVIGVIGTSYGVYAHQTTRTYREPVFVEDPVRIQLIDRQRITEAPIRVLRSDGQEVTSDLQAITFYFWNNGKAPIYREHVLRNLRLQLSGVNDTILDFRVARMSREVTGIKLARADEYPNRTMDVDFRILERNDGFSGQIIYEGDPKSELVIEGVIEGVNRVKTRNDLIHMRFWHRIWIYPLAVILFIIYEFFLKSRFFEKKIAFPSIRASAECNYENIRKIVKYTLILLKILILGLFVTIIYIEYTFPNINQGADSLLESIPIEIVPTR